MNKYDQPLDLLEKEISLISDKKDCEFSKDAFKGHKNRYKSDLMIINKYFSGGEVLDIGSSPYHLLFCLKKLGISAQGIDIDPNILKKFQLKNQLKVSKCDIEAQKLPFKDNQFAFIIFNETFEHLRLNPLLALREIRRVLKKGGILILTTPNLYALHKIIMFNLGMSFNNAYFEFKKIDSTGYMGHIREYSNKEIIEILEKTGFKIKAVYFKQYNRLFTFPPLNRLPLNIIGLMLDFFITLVSSLRQFQIVIAKKS